eukprot:TRINITY_DN7928_c0_g1_i1.p1 TRINITY_DN7928_c0_g1~~TRINITY_DN7928_c0_g1_i1.p1  ORF type:complete len:192 (-),score=19.86 TRINITY_DN7928_c0_g1_i1:47-622(-)
MAEESHIPDFLIHNILISPYTRSFLLISIPVIFKQLLTIIFPDNKTNNQKPSPITFPLAVSTLWLAFLMIWAFRIEIEIFNINLALFYMFGFVKFVDSMFTKLGYETVLLLLVSTTLFFISHTVGRFICVALIGGCAFTGYYIMFWSMKKKNYDSPEEESDTFILFFILTFGLSFIIHAGLSSIYYYAFAN